MPFCFIVNLAVDISYLYYHIYIGLRTDLGSKGTSNINKCSYLLDPAEINISKLS